MLLSNMHMFYYNACMTWLFKKLIGSIKKEKRVYLDYAAATPVDACVVRSMEPYWSKYFGNPSSIHKEGVQALEVLRASRKKVARALRAREEEIFFTSGGTESNNLAIHGTIEAIRKAGVAYKDMHIITSKIEHVSVLKPIQHFENLGVSVTYLDVDEKGRIIPETVLRALKKETVLISLMYVNNEIGTITPMRKIAGDVRLFFERQKRDEKYPHKCALVHSDASQAPLFLDASPERLNVDLLTIDSQKVCGPKGVGLLYKKHDAKVAPFMEGGGQERGLRPGTEALPLIVGFSEAMEIAVSKHKELGERTKKLQQLFIEQLQELVPEAEINGDLEERVPNNINISLPNIDTEFLVIKLDHNGVSASTASACVVEGGVSHVVSELNKEDGLEKNALRFTLGKDTTEGDIKTAVRTLARSL